MKLTNLTSITDSFYTIISDLKNEILELKNEITNLQFKDISVNNNKKIMRYD